MDLFSDYRFWVILIVGIAALTDFVLDDGRSGRDIEDHSAKPDRGNAGTARKAAVVAIPAQPGRSHRVDP